MRRTSLAQLAASLKALEVPRDHVYVVHSSLLKFGLVEGGVAGVHRCLMDALGDEATLLMPAFTLSFGRSRTWDYHGSPAETGALTEYYRKLPGTRRTVHPMHSLSVSGLHAEAFASCTNLSSFGPGSPYALLVEMDAINIALGTEFEGGATFLHHTEEEAEVPYRFHKEFPGNVVGEDGETLQQVFTMFARDISRTHEYVNDWDPVWNDLVQAGLVTQQSLHGANLLAFEIKPTHEWFLRRLRADPLYCARRVHSGDK